MYHLMIVEAQEQERATHARQMRHQREWAELNRIDQLEAKLRAAHARLNMLVLQRNAA